MTKRLEKSYLLILILILLVGFLVRFYRFDNPIADWHSWRQADTSAVSRNFITYGFDLLHPRMNNISNVQSGLDNPQGYFFAEFPIYNATQAGLFVLFHGLTIEEWGRIVTMLTSVFAGLFLFLLVSRHSNKATGLLAALFYMFIPFDIYYGRVILPDPSMTMAILGGTYFFDKWIDEKSQNKKVLFYVLTIVFTALSFLLKPIALFFALPMLYLAWRKFGFKFLLRLDLWAFLIISVAPLAWWRWWESHYPEGIPAFLWLFNSNNIRFHPAFFRWILYERLTKLISGYVGILFVISGVAGIWKAKRERLFFFSFIASSIIYVCTIATGNVQHDYYQIPIMPTVAITMAFGAVWLFTFIKKYVSETISFGVVAVLMLISFYFAWQQVQPYFDIDNPSIIAAGQAVQKLTPSNAEIIANYNGDSSLLYQTDRQGWASFEHDVPTLHKMGAQYLLLVNPTSQDMVFAKQYKVIAHTSQYVIFDLNEK
jgi:dolichyl-phosphate-mannose-protein mannosyltransferase